MSYTTGTLTPEQEDFVASVRGQWATAATTTEPVDEAAAEQAIRAAYTAAGRSEPRIVWADSPCGGLRITYQACGPDQRPWFRQGDHQCMKQMQERLGAHAAEKLRGQLRRRLRLFPELPKWQWGISGLVYTQLYRDLPDDARGLTMSSLDPIGTGEWFAYNTCARHILDLPPDPVVDAVAAVTRAVGWWVPMDGLAVVSRRPVRLERDPDLRLHSTSGPALGYGDGWGVWAWHGVRVPSWVITGPTVERIHAEPNAEVRRCAVEVMGWDAYARQAGLSLVASCPDRGNPGQTLDLYDTPAQIFQEPVRVLVCANGTPERDGTRRRFGLLVPAQIDDPLTAAAWTYGLGPGQYAALARRT